MLFNSIEFGVFFLVFLLCWYFVKGIQKGRWVLITISSFFFYGWWDWRFTFLMLFSGMIDFLAGFSIYNATAKKKKVLLLVSIVMNLSVLLFFKYATFIQDLLIDVLGIKGVLPVLNTRYAIILPLGISFYTFQSMSYTIDIYNGKMKPTKNIFHFFSYLLMFPQLVAGPIVRAKDVLHQLTTNRRVSEEERWHAFQMICFGLFRKVVIADNLAFFVDSAYQGKSGYDGFLFWWVVSFSFALQIYCDFSGYSLIARGLVKLLGYRFRMNFNHPYFASSFRGFWQRWHISLSTWFRDYVYIPLGGSKNGTINWLFALFTTMLLSGLWHGANYTFLVWGGLHFMFLWIEKKAPFELPLILRYVLVLLGVNIAWVFFRSSDINQAFTIVDKMIHFSDFKISFIYKYVDALFFLFLGVMVEFFVFTRKKWPVLKLWYSRYPFDVLETILAIFFILWLRGEGKQFIYFQF